MKAAETQAKHLMIINQSSVHPLNPAIIIILFLLTANTLSVSAQVKPKQEAISPTPNQKMPDKVSFSLEKGMNEFGVWGGGAFHAPTLIGTTEDSRLVMVGIRYGRIFATSKQVAYEYTIDAVPLTVVSLPGFIVRRTGSGLSDFAVEKTRRHVYGGGVSPIGFKINFKRHSRLQPFVSTSGGLLYFREPVPVRDATQFNFTFDFGGGIQILARARRALTVGYKFQHISNANRSQVNPGIDANVIYAGFSLFR